MSEKMNAQTTLYFTVTDLYCFNVVFSPQEQVSHDSIMQMKKKKPQEPSVHP